MESIINLQKQKNNKKSLSELSRCYLIDSSGSTSGSLLGSSILSNEFEFMKDTKGTPEQTVLWNSEASICNRKEHPISTGGTSPACIFRNTMTSAVYENSDIIFFMTDGEIDQYEVTNLGNELLKLKNKVLYICVLYSHSRNNQNISVFSPFMNKNCLIIQNNQTVKNKYDVIYVNGEIKSSFNVNSTINYDTLLNIKVSTVYPNIPKGYQIISETDDFIRVANFDKLMTELVNYNTMTVEDWENIIKMMKVLNRLDQIREFIDKCRNGSINKMIDELRTTITSPIIEKKNELIKQIMQLQDSTDESAMKRKQELVTELQILLPQARNEEMENAKKINVETTKVRSYWENIRNILSHYQTASYTLNDMAGIANRAKESQKC